MPLKMFLTARNRARNQDGKSMRRSPALQPFVRVELRSAQTNSGANSTISVIATTGPATP
jgi:hypothetical protein